MNIFKKSQWSPYVAGALIGVVSWFAVLTAGKYLGVSTTFVRTIGMIESLFVPERVASMPYFVKEKPIIDWQWMEVLGILIGAFIAARLSGEFKGNLFHRCGRNGLGLTVLNDGLSPFLAESF